MPQSRIIYLGIKGTVVAVESASGRQLWATHLKDGDFVTVALDGDNLYAATHGEVFCLDPQTGDARWHNPLKGYGWGLVSIAAEGIPPDFALSLAAEKQRRDQEAAAAAAAS